MEVPWRLVRCGNNFPNTKGVILLEHGEVELGRKVQRKYQLDSIHVSRKHARLKLDANGQWSIEDLRSYNGVFVNSRKITPGCPVAICENDIIGFGKPTPGGSDVYVFQLVKGGNTSITALTSLPIASTSHSGRPTGPVRDAESEHTRPAVAATSTPMQTDKTCNGFSGRKDILSTTESRIAAQEQKMLPQSLGSYKQESLVVVGEVEPEYLSSSNSSFSVPAPVQSPILKHECSSTVHSLAPKETAPETPLRIKPAVKAQLRDTVRVSNDESSESGSRSVSLQGTAVLDICEKKPTVVEISEVPHSSALESSRSKANSTFPCGAQLKCGGRDSSLFTNPPPGKAMSTVPVLPVVPFLGMVKEPGSFTRECISYGPPSQSYSAEELLPHRDIGARVGLQASITSAVRENSTTKLNGTGIGSVVAITGVKNDVGRTSFSTSSRPPKMPSPKQIAGALCRDNVQVPVRTDGGDAETIKSSAEPARKIVWTRQKTASFSKSAECSTNSKQNRHPSHVLGEFFMLRDCSVVIEPLEMALLKSVCPSRSIQQSGQDVDKEGHNSEDSDASSKKDLEDTSNGMFSQEDEIIILSDGDEYTCATSDSEFKKLPGDDIAPEVVDGAFEHVDFDEPSRWNLKESATDTTINKETAVGLVEDEEIVNRLVWNDADFEESDMEAAGKDIGDKKDAFLIKAATGGETTVGLVEDKELKHRLVSSDEDFEETHTEDAERNFKDKQDTFPCEVTTNRGTAVGLVKDDELDCRLVWYDEDFEKSDTDDAGEKVEDKQDSCSIESTTNRKAAVRLDEGEESGPRLLWNNVDFEESDTVEVGNDVEEKQDSSIEATTNGVRAVESDSVNEVKDVKDKQTASPACPRNFVRNTLVPDPEKHDSAKGYRCNVPTCNAFHFRLKNMDSSKRRSKKSSLKMKVLQSMKHRVPMAGGGSAVRMKETQQPSRSSEGPLKYAHEKPDSCKMTKKRICQKAPFPILSQKSCDDGPVPTHVATKRRCFQEASSCAKKSRLNSPKAAPSSLARNKLRDVVPSIHHDIPEGGCGISVRRPGTEQPRTLPGNTCATGEFAEKTRYKSRFKSRTVHLLDQVQSIPGATHKYKKPLKRGAALPVAIEVKRKAGDTVVNHCSETENPSSFCDVQKELNIELPDTTKSMTCSDSHLCLPALSFKQGHRISRVDAGNQRPTLKGKFVMQTKAVTVPSCSEDLVTVPSCAEDLVCTRPEGQQVPRRAVVSFTGLQPSARTDRERAEFAERVKASLKKWKLENSKKNPLTLDMFIYFVLGWNVSWLKEQMKTSRLPPPMGIDKVSDKRLMYSSMNEYKRVQYDCLCLQIWQAVFKEWQDYYRKICMAFQLVITGHECPTGGVMLLSCMVVADSRAMARKEYPMEGHLVRLDLYIKDGDNAALPVFGFVQQHKIQTNNLLKSSLPHLLQHLHSPNCVPIALQIRVKARNTMLNFDKVQRLTVVSQIMPILLQMEAVVELEKSPYGEIVVRPNSHYFRRQTGATVRRDLLLDCDEQQQEVVSSALHVMNSPGSDIRVLMLHGPPGTGKTHTLVGVIMGCLHGFPDRSILVVAPSNAAVDEIGRRLLLQRAVQIRQKLSRDKVLKLVRIGEKKIIHRDVRGIALEELVKKELEKVKQNRLQRYDRDIASKEERLKKNQIIKSGEARLSLRLDEEKHLKAGLRWLREQKREYLQNFSEQSRSPIELRVLRKANVILATLNSCRTRLMEMAFGRESPYCFSYVMVDEATKCTEVETLQCLQYRTNRLLLIGDSLHTPANVLSRHADRCYFQESLFERFYNCLQNEEDGTQAVFMLTKQNLMHSEI